MIPLIVQKFVYVFYIEMKVTTSLLPHTVKFRMKFEAAKKFPEHSYRPVLRSSSDCHGNRFIVALFEVRIRENEQERMSNSANINEDGATRQEEKIVAVIGRTPLHTKGTKFYRI